MRRVLYGRDGAPQHYLTGGGVLYTVGNVFAGSVQTAAQNSDSSADSSPVLSPQGVVVAWFDGAFVWDAAGVLAFIKGSVPGGTLELPRTAPLRAKLTPTPAPLYPLQLQPKAPPLRWVWSSHTLTEALSANRLT